MEIIKFDTLGLDPKILRAITEMGFEEPSPIQAKAIPEVMAGHDVIGQARSRGLFRAPGWAGPVAGPGALPDPDAEQAPDPAAGTFHAQLVPPAVFR